MTSFSLWPYHFCRVASSFEPEPFQWRTIPKNLRHSRLIREPKLVAAAIAGQKTQQRRDRLYAYPGETFDLEGMRFVATGLKRQRLGDMTDADAQPGSRVSLYARRKTIRL